MAKKRRTIKACFGRKGNQAGGDQISTFYLVGHSAFNVHLMKNASVPRTPGSGRAGAPKSEAEVLIVWIFPLSLGDADAEVIVVPGGAPLHAG
ncbi:MAG: hypothetical protein GY805_10680 [Chloroflexi bacterium]|nr:hypothetical protein [Chloroflexota bacterium]